MFVEEGRENLLSSGIAIQYLKQRKVTAQQVKDFRIGYSGRGMEIEGKKVFGGYLLLPLINRYQEVVGYITRSIKGRKGYYKTFFDPEGSKGFMFGEHLALEPAYGASTLVVVEGVFDALSVQRYCPAVVAMLTSRLSKAQLNIVSRYVKKVVYVPDNDETGQESRENFLKYNSRKFNIVTPQYNFKDPADWFTEDPEEFAKFWAGIAQ